MRDHRKAEEIVTQRIQLLSPLLAEDVDAAKARAYQKYGAPEAVFFDNGKQYRTRWMTRACAKMGIRLLYAKLYAPEATGKVERFNRVVDAFLAEAALEKPQSLDKLNELFRVWLEECYQHKPHSALANHRSPAAAYQSDSKAIRFLDAETIANAFRHCEVRKVDKAGCISFAGRKYEVGLHFIGCKVDAVYDPADTTALTIEYAGHVPGTVKPLVIGEQTGKRPRLPAHLQQEPAASSRLLTAAGLRHQQRKDLQVPAVSYRPAPRGRSTAMFEAFYGLAHTPFTRDISTDQLYPSVMLEETLGRLEHAAKRQLFVVLTGDSGTGKTTAIRRFKDNLDPARFLVMYLADSKLTPRHFYKGLLEQLGCEAKFYKPGA